MESPAVVAEVRSQNFPSGEQIGTHFPVRWAGQAPLSTIRWKVDMWVVRIYTVLYIIHAT